MILLIPAGWSLWLTPSSPPEWKIILLIVTGGLFVSGAGCIANDLWDKEIDLNVPRTNQRPLAKGTVEIKTALVLLILMLILSFLVVISLPIESRNLCLYLALIALPLIIIYPSSKRWFKYPQFILSLCWGFAVLIPWAASQSNLNGGIPLLGAWAGTLLWTFGFDTIYAMSDYDYDKVLGLNSSAISLHKNSFKVVSLCYLLTCICLGLAALFSGIGFIFWPIWAIATINMQIEVWKLKGKNTHISKFGKHFSNQVFIGGLILLGLILGRLF